MRSVRRKGQGPSACGTTLRCPSRPAPAAARPGRFASRAGTVPGLLCRRQLHYLYLAVLAWTTKDPTMGPTNAPTTKRPANYPPDACLGSGKKGSMTRCTKTKRKANLTWLVVGHSFNLLGADASYFLNKTLYERAAEPESPPTLRIHREGNR